MRLHLTDLAIRKLPHPERGYVKYWDTQTPAFGVRVSPGSKSFIVMQGKERRLTTIGRYPDFSLSDARKEAKRLLAHERPKTRSESTSAALTAYFRDIETSVRPNTLRTYKVFLHLDPDKPLDRVKPTDVHQSPHSIMAWRIFFNWCIRHGYTDTNPFQYVRVKYNERDRVLSDDEISALWQYEHEPYSKIVRLLILTGQRRNQIAQLQPDWLGEDTITFPSSIMKSGRVHTIPLTDWQKQYVQHTTFNGWSKAKARMDKHTGVNNYVLHDFRRYFSTTMAKLGVPLHVTEHLLDHRSTVTGVAAIYNRHTFLPEMRSALRAYENHLSEVLK